MTKTTLKRTSFCSTKEMHRQLELLCETFGENKSQVISRALQLLHFSLRIPTLSSVINEEKTKEET